MPLNITQTNKHILMFRGCIHHGSYSFVWLVAFRVLLVSVFISTNISLHGVRALKCICKRTERYKVALQDEKAIRHVVIFSSSGMLITSQLLFHFNVRMISVLNISLLAVC